MNVQIQKLSKYNIKKFTIVLNFFSFLFNCIPVFLSTFIVSYFICFIFNCIPVFLSTFIRVSNDKNEVTIYILKLFL